MFKSEFPYFIAKKLRSRKGSSFSALITKIAIGSVALGIAVMVVTSSIFNGFKHTIQEKIFSLAGHMTVKHFDSNDSFDDSPILRGDLFREDQDTSKIHVQFQEFAWKAGILKTKTELAGVVLKGIGTGFDSLRFQNNILRGKLPNRFGKKYSKEIMISQKLANKLRLDVGKKAIVYFVQDPPKFRPVTISGIYDTGIEEIDELYIIADIRLIQRINNWESNQIGGYNGFIKDFNRLDQEFQDIYYALRPELDAREITNSTRYGHLFDWFTIINRNALVFMVIILLVVILNIIAILLIMILERTEMIGTFKALGATDRQIQWVFTLNAVRLVVQGLIIGNALGIGLCWLQQQYHIIPLDPTNYYMSTVPILFNWKEIAAYNLLMTAIISAITFLPTLIISRIQPIKAIKFD